jgi:DNA-binding response OmpR family regulator
MGAGCPKVLLVEDDPLLRTFITELLEPHGYAVESTEAADSLARVADGAADLVLLDLGWPEADGLELCLRMRSLPAAAGVPIVALTDLPEESREVMAFAMGPDQYVTKPFDVSELPAAVARHCAAAKQGA